MSKLVLLRHGESMWNKKNLFTGWVDVPLSENGMEEVIRAGESLKDVEFDIIYTSAQVRSIQTAMLVMMKNKSSKTPVFLHKEGKMSEWTTIYDDETGKDIIPVVKHWQLNERYYGQLQGHNKVEAAKIYGSDKVHEWRRSYDIPPPGGECLNDTAQRTIPFFRDVVMNDLAGGRNVLVSAHGNSLRSIVMYVDNLSKEEVLDLEISMGKPILYEYVNSGLIKHE